MVVCLICSLEFENNSGGQLTNHINRDHKITLSDYIITTELDNIEPKCQCGFCDERPFLYRGKFSKYAKGHNKFKWIESRYIDKFGYPECPTCGGDIVKFNRGIPNSYCSHVCQPSNWNQDKVRKTVMEKYGVDNVFQIPSIVEDIRKKLDRSANAKKSRITKSIRYKNGWFDKEVMEKTMIKNHGVTHYSKTKKFREESSKRMKLKNPMFDRWI